MRRDEAIQLLKQVEPELRARGVLSLALFGSIARDEAGPDSDVDVMVELDESRRITLFDLSGMRLLIQDHLGQKTDIALRHSLRPSYRKNIEADAVCIF